MSEWITDRPPTEEDAGPIGLVWTCYDGKIVPCWYDGVDKGTPWMRMIVPKPYVKPQVPTLDLSVMPVMEAVRRAMLALERGGGRINLAQYHLDFAMEAAARLHAQLHSFMDKEKQVWAVARNSEGMPQKCTGTRSSPSSSAKRPSTLRR